MNQSHLRDTLTDEQRTAQAEQRATLDAQVAALKSKPERDAELDQAHRSKRDGEHFGVADVMPEMIASLERQKNKWKAFCDGLRPQFDALPEAKACPHHPTILRQKLFEETCQKSRMDADGRFLPAWAPCPECSSDDARAKVKAFWTRRGVPARVAEATLSNFKTDTEERTVARGKVQEWVRRNGVFLLLVGTTGTGKGHLAVGCLKAQGNGLFITHADMLGDLRASYTLKTTKEQVTTWQECDMFVLDEFGLSPGGKDEEPMMYQVLSKRYEERRPTIITSNLDLDQLREAIGFRLLDRMQEDCTTVVCTWPSWRTGK